MEWFYCGCHSIIFNDEEDYFCPSCNDEWRFIDSTDPHHPDYMEETEWQDED